MIRIFYLLNSVLLVFGLVSFSLYLRLLDQLSLAFFTASIVSGALLYFVFKLSLDRLKTLSLHANALVITVLSLVMFLEVLSMLAEDKQGVLLSMTPLFICTAGLYFAYTFIYLLEKQAKKQDANESLRVMFSGTSSVFSFIMAMPLVLTALLVLKQFDQPVMVELLTKMTDRGVIPPLTLLLFFWGSILLVNKLIVLMVERHRFIHHPHKSPIYNAFTKLDKVITAPKHGTSFLIDLIWKSVSEFYAVPRYISWAIPVLGFIGTVLGISLAAQGIQVLLSQQQSAEAVTSQLGAAISPLGIAFDTTLIALSLSVCLVLLQTAVQRYEHALVIEIEEEFSA